MVKEIYGEQLKWFTRKLIEIRLGPETDGYHAPIDFDPNIITDSTAPNFDIINRTPYEHIVHMLAEIKGNLLENKPDIRPEPSWTTLENNHVEITGYTTELLKTYLKNAFGESFRLFGEGRDERNRVVLTYSGQNTIILITGNELSVFRCLLRNFGEVVTFEELSGEIMARQDFIRARPLLGRESRSTTEEEKEPVRSAVNEVREKLKRAAGSKVFPEIIESVWKIGYKMVI